MPELATTVVSYGDNLDILRRYLPDAVVDLVCAMATIGADGTGLAPATGAEFMRGTHPRLGPT